MDFNLSDELKQAISIAQSVAKEYSNEKISPAHLLKALMHKDIGLTGFLDRLGKDYFYIEEWAEVRIESYPKGSRIPENPPADEHLQAAFTEADNIRLKLGRDDIDPICLLASLSTPGVGFTYEQLKTFPVNQNEIIDSVLEKSDIETAIGGEAEPDKPGQKAKKPGAILKFCIDKISLARQGKLDPVVARDREIRMIAEILSRRSKPNVILIGDPGVGKTAVVDGFVQAIASGKIIPSLREAKVFELDTGSLIAGASYKGEIEDRLKNIIKEIKSFEKAILFVDDIHTMLDKQGGMSGAANLLKPELSRGEITLIGTTSIDNYTKFIESDESFKRSFETIRVEEPTEDQAWRMLQSIVPHYSEHHGMKAETDVIKESLRLAKRYLKERSLPDSAIDLLDRTMAVVKMAGEIREEDIEDLKNQLSLLKENKEGLAEKELMNELNWVYLQAKNKVSEIILALVEEERDVSKMTDPPGLISYLGEILGKVKENIGKHRDWIEKADVGAIVSAKTGIPLGKVQTKEKERLLNINDHLKQRVVGQDHAIKSISEAILESRSGLSKPGQPIGSFFFLGPTGTGKTELAKTLAEFLFQDESSMIRFDMSEFKEEHSAALLYGAPPGYVGYEEGGVLVNKIRQQPYSVVLFDEIEKAHASVFDIFLQILDEGKLHDRLGKEGDFSNSVVLFTSNIGSQFIVESFERGEIPKSNELMEIMTGYFRPEFLGRLTEIIPFAPISKEVVILIFNIHLKNLKKMLEGMGIKLEVEKDATEKLAMSGFTPKYGARPILGVIRNELRRPLSKKIIAGEVAKGNLVTVRLDDNGEIIWDVA